MNSNIKLVGRTLQFNGAVVARFHGDRENNYGYTLASGKKVGRYFAYFSDAVREARLDLERADLRFPIWMSEITEAKQK